MLLLFSVFVVVLCQEILISPVAKLMEGTIVIFNPPGKISNVLLVSKGYMIKVPVAFCSVTEARINTCCYIAVVNFHGHLVKYIYEQEASECCMCCTVTIKQKT